jgi:hypothetical protein
MPEARIMEVSEWLINNSPELKVDIGTGSVQCASGLQFASRFVGDPVQDRIFDYLPDSMLHRIENRDVFPRVLVLDKWTGNSDGRQAVFQKLPNRRSYRAIFIDQGYCFNAAEWNFFDSPLRGVFARNAVYEEVTGWHSFSPTLSEIEQIDVDDLWSIASEVPKGWYEHNSRAFTQLVKSLHERRFLVRELITDFRNSSRSPFPNWK